MITHLPSGRLFPNNVALKPVVKLICQRLLAQNVGIIRAGDDEEDTKFICDLVVYTKNRNFRLFLSSKNRKTNVLKLADYCRFYGLYCDHIFARRGGFQKFIRDCFFFQSRNVV